MKRDTIGSSDVAAILGVSPYQSPGEVWARLVGLVEDDASDTRSQARGRILEPALLAHVAERTGMIVRPGPAYTEEPLRRSDHPWAHARPDGILLTPSANMRVAVVEAKSRRTLEGWGEDGSDGVPVDVALQAMWEAWICGLTGAIVVAYGVLADDLRVYWLSFEEDRLVALRDAVARWRNDYVETGEPPPATPPSVLASVLPYSGKKERVFVTANADLMWIARARANLAERRKWMDANLAEMDGAIAQAIGEHYGLQDTDGETIATWGPRKGAERGPSAKRVREIVKEWRAEADRLRDTLLSDDQERADVEHEAWGRVDALRACADLLEATITSGKDGRTFRFVYEPEEGDDG